MVERRGLIGGFSFGGLMVEGFSIYQLPLSRSSSRELRIRVPTCFLFVYFSKRALSQKRAKGHYWGT